MQIGGDADMQMGQMGQRCRWGRDADGVEMQRAEMHIGAERQICRYTERYIVIKRQRETWGERGIQRDHTSHMHRQIHRQLHNHRYRSETEPLTETCTEGQAETGTETHRDMTDT